jgi:hypothetical protein
MWPHGVLGPARRRRRRTEHLKHQRRSVDRLRRDRRQPQPDHAAGVPIHRRGQFDPGPPQRDRINPEHIQAGGVEGHVLPRTSRLQLPIRPLGSRSDIPVARGGAREGAMPGLKPFKLPIRRRPGRLWDHAWPETDVQALGGLVDHRLLRGFRLLGVLPHDRQRCVAPPRVDLVMWGESCGNQSGLTMGLIRPDPSADSAFIDAALVSFGGIAITQRAAGIELCARFVACLPLSGLRTK